jgi:hypothetical protein
MFVWTISLLLALSASGAELHFNFGDYAIGTVLTNFDSVVAGEGQPGQWSIVGDQVPSAFGSFGTNAPTMNQSSVLAQTSTDMMDEHFPILVYTGDIFRNFKLSTRFKIVSGVTEQMAGIVFRYQNASNFYVLRASALGHNVRFYKMVDGVRSAPIGPEMDVAAGTWHSLQVECRGNEIDCGLDGKPLMPPLQDNSFPEGKIGFWTKSDSVTHFRDADLDYTLRIPAAQGLVNNIMQKEPRILTLRIYTLNAQGQPKILASSDLSEVSQAGTDAEKKAISDGTVSYGRSNGVNAIVLPFRDRNGDPMAAMRIRLKSFFGETRDNAMTRATQILKMMQAQISTSKDLLE